VAGGPAAAPGPGEGPGGSSDGGARVRRVPSAAKRAIAHRRAPGAPRAGGENRPRPRAAAPDARAPWGPCPHTPRRFSSKQQQKLAAAAAPQEDAGAQGPRRAHGGVPRPPGGERKWQGPRPVQRLDQTCGAGARSAGGESRVERPGGPEGARAGPCTRRAPLRGRPVSLANVLPILLQISERALLSPAGWGGGALSCRAHGRAGAGLQARGCKRERAEAEAARAAPRRVRRAGGGRH
jgi:hypothetical protein